MRNHKSSLAVAAVALVLTFCAFQSTSSAFGTRDDARYKVKRTVNLIRGRFGHSATVLSSGNVLVLGGFQHVDGRNSDVTDAEQFDPARGTWFVDPTVSLHAAFHTATLLANGTVLIAGGYHQDPVEPGDPEGATVVCSVVDLTTHTSSFVGNLLHRRGGHTAVRLNDGRVLAIGGSDGDSSFYSSCEIYDPVERQWSDGPSMSDARFEHTTTVLNDGRILACGGYSGATVVLDTCEIFDPTTGSWTRAASMNSKRYAHSSLLLADGRVLVVGGASVFPGESALASAEVYDPANDTWTPIGDMAQGRRDFGLAALGNGQVVACGGTTDGSYPPGTSSSIEALSSMTANWQTIGDLRHTAGSLSAVTLNSGKVLICGGFRAGFKANKDSTLIRAK